MVSLRVDLEELLQCPICFDKLAQPKLLPCSHRFCKECIRREMERSASTGPQSSFPCPLCKRTAHLGMGQSSEEWINNFETDHLLEDILEKLEPSGETLCADHHVKIMVVCHDCQILGCVTCAWNHHRQCGNVGYTETELVRIKSELSKQLETFERAIKEKLQIRNHLHIISENVEYLTQQRLMFIRSNICHQLDNFNTKFTKMRDKIVDNFNAMCFDICFKQQRFRNLYSFQKCICEIHNETGKLHNLSTDIVNMTNNVPSSIHGKSDVLYNDACDEVKQERRRRMDAIQHVSNMLTDVDVAREMASINEALQTSTLDLLQGQKLLKDNRRLLEETVVPALREISGLSASLEHVEEDFITGEHQVHLDYTEEIQNMEKLLNDVLAEHKNQMRKGLITEFCPMREFREPIKSTAEHYKRQAQSQKRKHRTKMKKRKRKKEYTGMYTPDSSVGVEAVPIKTTYESNNKQADKSLIVFIIICIILCLGISFLFRKRSYEQ